MRRVFALWMVALAIAAGCRQPVEEIRGGGAAVSSAAAPLATAADDWPVWRGAAGDNKATGPLRNRLASCTSDDTPS